jgi:hypothetical protein
MRSPLLLSRQLTAALAAAACLSLGTVAGAAPVITLSPAAGSHAVGDGFSLTLSGSGFSDLYAFQFALSFTPGVLGVTGVTEGDALSSVGSTFFVPGAIDNGSGVLELTGDTLIGAIPGFSGDAWLATISFQALGAGAASVELNDLMFLDSSLNIIDVTSSGARFEITSTPGRLPEPDSPALALLALASAAWACRRSR